MSHSYKNKRKISRSLITVIVSLVLILVSCFINSDVFIKWYVKNNGEFDTSKDFISVIDVGQAECILIYSNGKSALFDVGTSDSANNICEVLNSCNIDNIDTLMISHLHSDHIGGIRKITEFFGVSNLILPEISVESEGLGEAEYAINKITRSGGKVYTAVQGMNFKIGNFEITILACYSEMSDENNRSIIAVAEHSGTKFMFTGDAETKVEKLLLEEGLNLKCDILSVGHHGSSTSSSDEFLKAVRPRYAVISAGEGNMYGHPHNEVLASLEYIGAKIYRTDRNGDITFYVKDGVIKPVTEY